MYLSVGSKVSAAHLKHILKLLTSSMVVNASKSQDLQPLQETKSSLS